LAGLEVAGATPLKETSKGATAGGHRAVRRVGKIILWALLIAFAALFLYPLLWLLAASLKPRDEVFDRLIPQTFTPHNYVQVWQELPLLNWFLTSVIIAVLAAGLAMISSAMIAFGFLTSGFRGAGSCSALCWPP
jgi:multiple sugar transport system permease protein